MKPLILILMLVPLASCSREATAIEKTVTPVRIAPVEMFQPTLTERYSASITPGRQVTLAFRVAGYIQELRQTRGADGLVRALEPGDIVPAGTVLARLREEDYQVQVDQAQGSADSARENEKAARGQLEQARAGFTKAEANLSRAKALFAGQSLTRSDFDSAQAQYDSARGDLQAAQAQLDAAAAQIRTADAALASARLAQRDTCLTAPFTAAAVHRNVELGMLVAAGTQAYSLADISHVKATFGVSDSVAVQIKPGTAVSIVLEALPGRRFDGAVNAIAAVADQDTRLFQIEVSLPNEQRLLRPGLIASLSLGSAAPVTPVPVVPLSAVIRDRQGGSAFAVMVVEGGVAHERPVTLGPTYGDQLAVTSGVKPGDHVIRDGATLVTDGETVEVLP
jgi:multidrug efflux pump subunit AcrA (membrane-fusion protein)